MVLLISSPYPMSIPIFPKGNVYGALVLPSPSLDFGIFTLDTSRRTVYLRPCKETKQNIRSTSAQGEITDGLQSKSSPEAGDKKDRQSPTGRAPGGKSLG